MTETTTSSDTQELALELQEERPDPARIKWLVEDLQANVREALQIARLTPEAILRNPKLKPHLQKYLQ